MQARKRSKLPENLTNAANVTYVTVDFTHQSLAEQLTAAGFDKSKPTVFTLEGVSQYITKEAVSSTIEELATLIQTTSATFFISYVDELLDKDPEACFGTGYPNAARSRKTIKSLSAKVGEPWISFYTAEEIASLLSRNGFSVAKTLLSKISTLCISPRWAELFRKTKYSSLSISWSQNRKIIEAAANGDKVIYPCRPH